jgi:hypothetical protein
LPQDWQTQPFTDISVVGQEDNCPNGTESVFERAWYGTTIGCVPTMGYYDIPVTVNKRCVVDSKD